MRRRRGGLSLLFQDKKIEFLSALFQVNILGPDGTTVCLKQCLKLTFIKTKVMASGPITSWQIDGETKETVTDSIFLISKITVNGDCSHEIKRRLILGRKAMINLDSGLKSRDITLLTNVCIVKAMVLPIVMYRHEILTLRKAERKRIDAFKLWRWRRFLRVSWTARRSNQFLLKEISQSYDSSSSVQSLSPV